MEVVCFFFFFFKQKTAYEMLRSLVGSEMCIRDRLFFEPGIVGQLERLHQMRLEAPARPDPLHGGRTDIAGLRHRPAAPMRLAVGPAFLRQPDDLLDLARRDRRLAAAPLGHPAELPQPVRGEPLAPADY